MIWWICTRRRGCISWSVLILYVFIVLAELASAVHTAGDRVFEDTYVSRTYLSSRPVTRALRQLADRRFNGTTLRKYISEVRALTEDQELRINGTKPPHVCPRQSREWVLAARSLLSDQGVALSDERCPYVFSYSGWARSAPLRKRDLSLGLSKFTSQFRRALRSPGVNFSTWGATLTTNFMFFTVQSTESYKCELSVDCIIELQRPGAQLQRFFVALVQSYNPRDRARNHSSLFEIVATDLKSVLSRRWDPLNTTRMPCTNAQCEYFSTLFEKTTGLVTFSHLIPMQLHKVPLFDPTVEENEDKFSVANSTFEDLTASNIAILALPLVLCFIPISPMADVSQTATLIYALVTDLFSAVPLIVKGAELLIKFNSNPHTTHSETWVFGSGNARLTEIWSTQCRITVDRNTGAVIVISGLWAISVGLVTEYLAWRWMIGQRKSAKHVAVLRERNYIRRVGQDTYQVRSKYLTKMLDGTSARHNFPGSSSASKTPGSPGTPGLPPSPRSSIGATPADFRLSIVTPRGSVAGSVESPPLTPVACFNDDFPVEEIAGDEVRTSRLSSIFLQNAVLAEDDESTSQPWRSFFLGLGLGILLPIFAYFYMHCLGGVQRSRRKRKYYLWGIFLGALCWGPIIYYHQKLV